MAKKRIDRERDKTSAQRIMKAGRTALAIGAGAVLFSRSNIGTKALNEFIPAISDTKKAFSKELLGKKRTASSMYEAFNKTIGMDGQAFKATLNARKQIGRNYKINTSSTRNFLGSSKNMKQLMNNQFYHDTKDSLMEQTYRGVYKEVSNHFGDKYSKNAYEQVIRSAMNKMNDISDKTDISPDFLKRTAKKYGIAESDLDTMLRMTMGAKNSVTDDVVMNNTRRYMTVRDALIKKDKEALKKNTKDNLPLNKLGKKFGVDDFEEKLLGSRPITIKEFLDRVENGELLKDVDITSLDDLIANKFSKFAQAKRDGVFNPIDALRELAKDTDEYDNVIFDKNLRIRTRADGSEELVDLSAVTEIKDKIANWFNSTLPGKVLTKGTDRQAALGAPEYAFFRAGTKSNLAFLDNAEDGILKNDYIYHRGSIYSINKNGDQYGLGDEVLSNVFLRSNEHGSFSTVTQRRLGSNRLEPTSSDNKILQWLDIGQDGRPSPLAESIQFFDKFKNPDWERNIIGRIQSRLNSNLSVQDEIKELMENENMTYIQAMARMHEDNQRLNRIFSNKASSSILSQDAVARMINYLDSSEFTEYAEQLPFADEYGRTAFFSQVNKTKEILNLALSGASPEETIKQVSEMTVGLNNSRLVNLVSKYRTNTQEFMSMLSIESSASKKIPILDISLSETNVMGPSGIIRQELLKEATSDRTLTNILKNAGILSGQEEEAFTLLEHWRRFEAATKGGDFTVGMSNIFKPGGALEKYEASMTGESLQEMNVILKNMSDDYGIFHKGSLEGINERYYSEFNKWEAVQMSQWRVGSVANNIIEALNDTTKAKSMFAEFTAGRSNLQNVTELTDMVQYMINRLSYGVEESGLGFSHNSMGSPLDSVKNMMLKRVLPAMAIYTGFDYLNDTSQDMFGVGITGAVANSIANLDIAGRGLAYKTGIGQGLDWFKQSSVIAEYWTGSHDFQTADERKEWYQDGYTPVRKSRFWAFGSASEFRGGDISFFQPNFLRRIHSDYKDEVLYGGNSEKWAHSIIPTPTHPLSTIRYLMDPYWLEKKHIDDAPTPLTGKMFAEGSFWGAILNPTVGEIIKPQIMLPEVRKRLTGRGHDARQIVAQINQRIKLKGSDNDDMLVVNGTDIRNATYVPYGNAVSTVLTIDQYGNAPGINYMQGVRDLNEYRTPDGSTYTENSGYGSVTKTVSDNTIVNNRIIQELGRESGGLGQQLISDINNQIKSIGRGRGRNGGSNYSAAVPNADREGTYYYNNMINEYNNYVSNYYSDKLDPSMINRSKASDYLADAKHSVKNLSGIYGFLGDTFFGDDSYTFRYESASSYSSFSRGFWDAGIGGLGGGVMEIARRFFPSQDRSRVDYNPLRNNAPDWLPESFHQGVLWTKVTKGEMRLPGAGYEKLNELHPDQFADDGYGAFDRFKILADVAPNSKEYKIWRNIAKHTIYDTDLLEEMKEIEARTKRMSGNHEFYNYQYINSNTKYEQGVVKEVQRDGTVLLANNQVLTLAGIEFNENYAGELNQLLTPGKKITYRTTDDAINDLNEGVRRNAAIFIGSDNVNKKLMDMGVADRDITDTSAIGQLATVGTFQETLGAVQELIAHARIPILHNKLMHIESPLESFISEQVYGANFQTWDHPIQGFVYPMLNEVRGQSMLRRLAAVGYKQFHFNKVLQMSNTGFLNKTKKFGSGMVLATLDPAAMLGGTVNWMLKLNNGRSGDGTQVLGAWSRGAKIGSDIGTALWAYSNADNPFEAALSFGALGADIWRRYEFDEFAETVLKKSTNWKYGAAIGAALGLGISAMKNSDFDKERMFGKYKPKKYKKINELNEYFDRLEYIKYKGLYEDAARKAALLEGTAVKDIFKELDKNKEKIAKLRNKAKKLLDKFDERDPEYISRINAINKEISGLQESGNHMFKGGKYTKSAVAYKKAMESTIYGLSEMATQDEILASVPDQYKDYFQEFMKVTDKSEQKKILSYLPDYMKRPLQAAWGYKLEDVDSNRKFFKSHKLPTMNWRGWKPNINLKHVQMKTIQNEGMLLADFGFYESEKAKAQYTMAPDIDNYDRARSGLGTLLNLGAELRGIGITTSNVSLEHTSAPGLWITSDIKQTIENKYEVGSNTLSNHIQGICANFI